MPGQVLFRGAGPALQAALGGEIQILFDNLYPTLLQLQDGKLNAPAVTTPQRSPSAPDIPTMRERSEPHESCSPDGAKRIPGTRIKQTNPGLRFAPSGLHK